MVYRSLHGLVLNSLSSKFERREIAYNLRDSENKLMFHYIVLATQLYLKRSSNELQNFISFIPFLLLTFPVEVNFRDLALLQTQRA